MDGVAGGEAKGSGREDEGTDGLSHRRSRRLAELAPAVAVGNFAVERRIQFKLCANLARFNTDRFWSNSGLTLCAIVMPVKNDDQILRESTCAEKVRRVKRSPGHPSLDANLSACWEVYPKINR